MSQTQTLTSTTAQLPPEPPSPEVISDLRLSEMIAGEGNHESKAWLILAMQPDHFYNQGGLHGLITELPGARNAYLGSRTLQKIHCEQSLAPIGLVAKEEIEGDSLKYGLSEEGEEFGKPLAVLLLGFGQEYDMSLFKLFGEPQSIGGYRSPYVRLRLIEEILSAPAGLHVDQLSENSGIPRNTISNTLKRLENAGLIQYRTWELGAEEVTYQLTQKERAPFKGRSAYPVQPFILGYLEDHGAASLTDLAAAYIDSLPEAAEKPDLQTARNKISVRFSELSKAGFVERVSRVKLGNREEKPEMLSDSQAALWTDLINRLEQFRTDPVYREKLRDLGNSFLQDAALVQASFNRLNSSSSKRLQQSLGVSAMDLVLKAIQSSTEPLTDREIADKIAEIDERHLSMSGLGQIRKRLENSKLIVRHEGRIARFSGAALSTSTGSEQSPEQTDQH